MTKINGFKPLGWYMLAGWSRPQDTWVVRIPRPEGWTDAQWDQLFSDIARDIYLDAQEDWAYGPHPDDVEAYRRYWLRSDEW